MQPINDASYDSVAEFLDAVHECRNPINDKYRRELLERDNENDWLGAGCVTGNDVLRLMREGWPAGQRKMAGLMDGFDTSELTPMDTRRRLVRGDMGDHLDIGSVYAGRIGTAWTSARRKTAKAPQRVDILVNVGVAAMQRADVVFWRGACAVALADKLSQAGYMVRIAVTYVAETTSKESVNIRVTVKDYDKPLDMATTATVLLPGFFRSLILAWTAGHAACKVVKPLAYHREIMPADGELLVDLAVRDESSARQWLARSINRINPAQAA